jgi:hypothetical protein
MMHLIGEIIGVLEAHFTYVSFVFRSMSLSLSGWATSSCTRACWTASFLPETGGLTQAG